MNNNTAKSINTTIVGLKTAINFKSETILDFLELNYEIDFFSPKFGISTFFTVREEHVCRMDLICQAVYNDPSYVDVLCKWNNITNPFSIQLGDVLICPAKSTLDSFFVTNPITTIDTLDAKSAWIDPARATKKDLNRLEQMKKAAYKEKNGSTDPKPTNLLREGEAPFTADGKAIKFAEYTTK